MTSHMWAALGLLAALAAVFMLGREAPRGRRLDRVWSNGHQEGWRDRGQMRDMREADVAGPDPVPVDRVAVDTPAVPAAAAGEFEPEFGDWTDEQLEALHDDLPGRGVSLLALPAGEHHRDWPTDTALPVILGLGEVGDGSPRTFSRWQVVQWSFMQEFRDNADEWDRALRRAAA